ncbi:MAG: type I glutamate--ammonia ligase [Parcubacteria group bacterium]|nr:type I glutamate--ammonia ligase [Parcubacteria group bacterium]
MRKIARNSKTKNKLQALLETARVVDLRFCDLLGRWQQFTITKRALTQSVLNQGLGFDGSSFRAWQGIHESDMIIIPDIKTAQLDPFSQNTLVLIGDIYDGKTKNPYTLDPRQVAKKASAYLKQKNFTAYFGPELEFFIFDNITFGQNGYSSYYKIDSLPGRVKDGYFTVPPADPMKEIRVEIFLLLEHLGLVLERCHPEVAAAVQHEINFERLPLVQAGDAVLLYKYVARNVAKKYGKIANFMPKPVADDNGSGMHLHQSLWHNTTPLFAGQEYAGLSKQALYYIGGILAHAPALCAFTNPTTNSYKRLVPHAEAPTHLTYSERNRSAAIRIPVTPDGNSNPKSKRLEVRFPDPSANPYLAFAAMLMAGLDGLEKKIHPGKYIEENIYEANHNLPQLPSSLSQALEALKQDNAFLLKGNVFTKDLINNWLDYKQAESARLQREITPLEFEMYHDA